MTAVLAAMSKAQLSMTSLPVGRNRQLTCPVQPDGRPVLKVCQPPGSLLSPFTGPWKAPTLPALLDGENVVSPPMPKFSAP